MLSANLSPRDWIPKEKPRKGRSVKVCFLVLAAGYGENGPNAEEGATLRVGCVPADGGKQACVLQV